jgi:hypothetical protein
MYRDRLLPTVALALIDREEPAFAILDLNLRRERPAAEALRARRVPFGLATTGYNDSQLDARPSLPWSILNRLRMTSALGY